MREREWGEYAAWTLRDRVVEAIGEEAAKPLLWRDGGCTVVSVQVGEPTAAGSFLRDHLCLDALMVEDAVSPNERPSLREEGGTVFLEVAVPVAQGFAEVALFLMPGGLVVVRSQSAPTVDEVLERWRRSPASVGPDPARLLHQILDAVVDSYFPLCDRIEDEVDELEALVFQGDGDFVERSLALKRQIVQARRGIAPLRDVLNGLFRLDPRWVPSDLRPYLQDVYDHTLRVAEMLDVNRDLLAGILDAHLSLVSNRLNSTMRLLTVVATFLMTAGLVAGVYGMNFEHMPELKWPWGYPMALAAMLLMVGAEWLYFRRKGWL
ncbi:MAG: magnesium/cobalt transporter CorA [Fimbriimonadales bacterium]|nr:magnesium/cobalt transporter CorA [Fimbriimonadales bacterium]